MRKLLSTLALLSAVAISTAAYADTFDFTAVGTGGGFSGVGTFVTTNNGDGSFTITGITGPGITGLIPPNGFALNDNQLFPSAASLVDLNGFAFTDVMGNTSFMINIAASGSGGYNAFILDSDGLKSFVPVSFAIVASTGPVPEPSGFVLLGTGVVGIAGLARRRLFA